MSTGRLGAESPASRWRILLTGPGCGSAAAPERGACEGVVGAHYARAHGARLRHHLPWLLGLAHGDRPLGVIGARCGTEQQSLFLERYLDEPVQTHLSVVLGAPVARSELAEVGNLAATRRGLGPLLVGALAALLSAAGRRWAVFTATAELRALFDHLELPCLDLGSADGTRLGPELADWGRYYADDPHVLATDLTLAKRLTAAHPGLARRGESLFGEADRLGRRLGRTS